MVVNFEIGSNSHSNGIFLFIQRNLFNLKIIIEMNVNI